jgi:hypothetical protein
MTTTGSCLCGTVRFEVSGPYKWMTHCHCSMCRKHHGTLYGTTLGVDKQNFRWLGGEDDIVHYRASPAFERPFCQHCGSTVPDASGDDVIVAAGTLTSDVEMKPRAHIFVASKSPMCEITDALKQFDEYPPGYGSSMQPTNAPPPAEALTGSCLCGDVAYAIDATPVNVVNCHCTRCQRSRGTAHATNVFARQEELRWLRGADKLRTYKVADAQAFTTTFCVQCGSLLPSLFEPIRRYNVPTGSLDRPLAAKPSLHIHVASRAPWFEITDTLPQYADMPPRDQIKALMF